MFYKFSSLLSFEKQSKAIEKFSIDFYLLRYPRVFPTKEVTGREKATREREKERERVRESEKERKRKRKKTF